MSSVRKLAVVARNYFVYRQHDFWAACRKREYPLDAASNFVISVASYPKRIHLVPAVFESLARQKIRPRKAYLVLSEEDFPERNLPPRIARMIEFGVEVVWVENNPYAVKKLMPVWGMDPDCAVITFDDDTIYRPQVTEGLRDAAAHDERVIAGYWGKALFRKARMLSMWFRESIPFERMFTGDQVYLLGGGGVWYPPSSLNERFLDLEAVHKIVPGRGSDIWFWAAAHAANSKHCWVKPESIKSLWIPIPQNTSTKPKETPGNDVLEGRFQSAIDYFGIRERLLNCLPDRFH